MDKDQESHDQKKARLLAEARAHRDALVLAKQHVKYGAKPQVILHNAFDQATYVIRTRMDALLSPTGLSVTAVAPYALKVANYLRRRGKLKPVLGVGLVLAGLGFYLNKRRQEAMLHG
ncbi:MAG: hypothetical protein ACXU8N_02570 [Telluria sp.]